MALAQGQCHQLVHVPQIVKTFNGCSEFRDLKPQHAAQVVHVFDVVKQDFKVNRHLTRHSGLARV